MSAVVEKESATPAAPAKLCSAGASQGGRPAVAPSSACTRAMSASSEAIARRDFMHLAKVAERSCLRFHASALAADPGILYWNGLTLQLIHRVRQLRDEGLKVFFTIDAGPHVKVFCEAGQLAAIKPILQAVPGVQDVLTARPGQGVMLEDEQGNHSCPWV